MVFRKKREPVVTYCPPPPLKILLGDLEYAIKIWREFDNYVEHNVTDTSVPVWATRDHLADIMEKIAGHILSPMLVDAVAADLRIPRASCT